MHLAPFPFVLDWANRDVAMWRVPQARARVVYLTFDDGPNPEATPALLDVLARHQSGRDLLRHRSPSDAGDRADHRRAAAEGHAIALHSHTKRLMALSPDALARTLDQAEARLTRLTGVQPCPAFRPHGGGRSGHMMAGLRQSGRRMVGWGMFLWDWDWFRARTAKRLVPRIAGRAGPGSIIVLHDGHHKNPRADRRYTIETVDRLIPLTARERTGVRDDLRRDDGR